MSHGSPRLLIRTIHFRTTIREVYAYPSAPPPKPVITTTGVEVHDSELPPSQPSIRVARPANVVQFPAARRVAGQRGVGFLDCLAGLALVGLFCELTKLLGWQ